MNIVQITPGAGSMYCGGCFRDNALVAALRRQGHQTLMVPLYLPLTLDEPDQSVGTPTFFGGINVYFDQKSAWFRKAPKWLHDLLSSAVFLKWASRHAARTRAADVGDLMLSMLRGEEGNQARELDDLIAWLRTQPRPDIVCLSNALLAGLARRLKSELNCAIACLLGGEDAFLDGLPGSVRESAWKTLAERCRDVDLFLPPTHYFAGLMTRRLALRAEQVRVVPNGINLVAYSPDPIPNVQGPPVLGYFARMCPEKGLATLVDAYLLLKKREVGKSLQLHVGGGCGPSDEPYVEAQRGKLVEAGVREDVQFFPNVDHAAKVAFYRKLTVFSVPALYGEAFGLYVIEALAAGVPIVQPRHAAFPELIEATGGGVLCEPGDPRSLADAIDGLLREPKRARQLGAAGRGVIARDFNIDTVATKTLDAFAHAVSKKGLGPGPDRS
jgi:glycosyltransferase involved in cell wall biosynthesis